MKNKKIIFNNPEDRLKAEFYGLGITLLQILLLSEYIKS